MLIIDGFMFYNELDMLLYRLNTLNDYVDFFIIVESKYTHSGKDKELYYNENKELFKDFHPKIIHIILDDTPFKHPNIDYSKNEQWENEHYQRNAIKNGIVQLNLNDDDVIIISDLDEIPDYNSLVSIKNNKLILNNIYSLRQDFYYYNLNTKMMSMWDLAKILPYKTFKSLNLSCQEIRQIHCSRTIMNGGWHLSYFGDKHFIQNKIQHFGHQEFNNEKYTDLNIIESRIKNSTDLYGRVNEKIMKISIKDNNYLPHNYEKYLLKYILY